MRIVKGLMVLAAVVLLTGCSDEINEDKPIAQVEAEAAKMKPEKLKAKVAEYEALLAEKSAGVKDIEKQIKELSISELMGDKANSLKAEMSSLTTSLDKLGKQMDVYAKELAAKQ
jgi:chromosome segregation ATPase